MNKSGEYIKIFKLTGIIALIAFLAACAGPSLRYKEDIFETLKKPDYSKTVKEIESNKSKQYGRKNSLLYYLDLGFAYHNSNDYKESEKYFEKADLLYGELLTKSISRGLGTLLINDITTEYFAPPYEKVLLNVFRALNYAYQDNLENALVEVRKLSGFLTVLRDSRENKQRIYKDDGFAQYLSALLYYDFGQLDDARISLEDSQRAYGWYSKDYGTEISGFVLPLELDYDEGELVFIHYNGIAPVKLSRSFQAAWNDAFLAVSNTRQSHPYEDIQQFENAVRAGILGRSITVAYPEFADVDFTVKSSDISVSGQTVSTFLAEDISRIAKSELKRKVAAQRLRMIARATIKYVLSRYITESVEKKHGNTAGIFAGIITGAISAGTEVADTRSWNTLPAQIRMARMRLKKGVYDVRLNFKNKFGRIIDTVVLRDIEIKNGKRTYAGYRTSY